MKLEIMVVPVRDVEKAKDFYARLGSASDVTGAMRRVGRPWRVREAHRRGRREPARLVRRVHGGGAGRDGAADVTDYDVIVMGADAPGEHACIPAKTLLRPREAVHQAVTTGSP